MHACSDDAWAKIENGIVKLDVSDFLQKIGGGSIISINQYHHQNKTLGGASYVPQN